MVTENKWTTGKSNNRFCPEQEVQEWSDSWGCQSPASRPRGRGLRLICPTSFVQGITWALGRLVNISRSTRRRPPFVSLLPSYPRSFPPLIKFGAHGSRKKNSIMNHPHPARRSQIKALWCSIQSAWTHTHADLPAGGRLSLFAFRLKKPAARKRSKKSYFLTHQKSNNLFCFLFFYPIPTNCACHLWVTDSLIHSWLFSLGGDLKKKKESHKKKKKKITDYFSN